MIRKADLYTIHGILQAKILEWVAFPFSWGSSQPRDRTQVSHIPGGFFTRLATREGPFLPYYLSFLDCLLSYCTPPEYSVSLMNGLNKKFQWYINRDIISLVDANPHCISLLKKKCNRPFVCNKLFICNKFFFRIFLLSHHYGRASF